MSDIRFILSEYNGSILTYSINMQTNRLESINIYNKYDDESANLNDIFVAKVANISHGINAAFIDYQKGMKGYLPLDNVTDPVLINRAYDGSLKAGDELLVQLEKEAVRTKYPVFTANLSIAGKYCVISKDNAYKGVSKKCSKEHRSKLVKLIPDDIPYGIIIRTNASELIENNFDLSVIEAEIRQLSHQMEALLTEGIHRTCYSKVWQSPPQYITALRDIHDISYSRIMTDNEQLYDRLLEYMKLYSPKLLERLVLYTDTSYPLNKLYSLETKLNELLSNKVWLKSGAYLVIEKTEAMYVIDVNSGKNISKKSSEEYIMSINLEAAKEIMYQLKLRNLTGIILVDFINMNNEDNKEKLLCELRQCAKQDMIQTTIVDMTSLGLVEITRQKNLKSLAEQVLINFKKNLDNE